MALPGAAPTVLVVEDDSSLRDWIEQHTPAIIVLDLSLLHVSGRDVQQELRSHADTRDIPIVVVTGDDTSDLNGNELACVLHKPVTGEALLDAVNRCLRFSLKVRSGG